MLESEIPRMFGQPETGLFGEIERNLSLLKLDQQNDSRTMTEPDFDEVPSPRLLTTPIPSLTYLDNTEEQISKYFGNEEPSTFCDQTLEADNQLLKKQSVTNAGIRQLLSARKEQQLRNAGSVLQLSMPTISPAGIPEQPQQEKTILFGSSSE